MKNNYLDDDENVDSQFWVVTILILSLVASNIYWFWHSDVLEQKIITCAVIGNVDN